MIACPVCGSETHLADRHIPAWRIPAGAWNLTAYTADEGTYDETGDDDG